MINSKLKGKVGELEFVKFLKDHGINARRGQQYKGTPDSPDIISDLENIHWEVKRTEHIQLYKYMKKAIEDASDIQIPVIAYRKNNEDWVCILRAEDLLLLVRDEEE